MKAQTYWVCNFRGREGKTDCYQSVITTVDYIWKDIIEQDEIKK